MQWHLLGRILRITELLLSLCLHWLSATKSELSVSFIKDLSKKQWVTYKKHGIWDLTFSPQKKFNYQIIQIFGGVARFLWKTTYKVLQILTLSIIKF